MRTFQHIELMLVQTHFVRRRNLVVKTTRNLQYPVKRIRSEFAFGQKQRKVCGIFKELRLRELSEACDPKFPFLRRFLWGLLWLVLVVSCITQCAISLKNYLSCPTNVNIIFKTNNIVTPPCVTFCTTDDYGRIPAVWPPILKNEFGNISYDSTDELLNKTKMDVSILWNISTFKFDSLTYNIFTWPFNIGAEYVEVKDLVTLTGVCITFKSSIKMPCSGKQGYLVIEATGDIPDKKHADYFAIFHSEAEIPLLRYYGPKANGVYMQLKSWTTAEIRMVEETFLNSWKKPCISETEYFQCEADCFEKLIRSESRNKLKELCRLPFMKQDDSVRHCKKPNELRKMLLASEESVDKVLGEGRNCTCRRPCHRMIYSVEYLKMGPEPKKLFDFFLAYPKCYFQSTNEEFSYGTTSFMADIGGALGLYLGMSVLGIVTSLEKAATCLCNLRRSRKK